MLTTKKMFLKGIVHELLWFLKGSTNNNELTSQGVNIWTPWQTEDGQLGKIYGYQFRHWQGEPLSFDGKLVRKNHDQISELIENLKKRPFSRRHVISAWNVEDLPDESISPQENVKNGKMALAPCHCLFQFYVREMNAQERYSYMFNTKTKSELPDEELHSVCNEEGVPKYFLDCQLYQRSADYPIGVPYNIASYALLTMMIAQVTGMVPGEFIHTFGDVHVYLNQVELFKEQLEREPLPLGRMHINPEINDIFGFTPNDFIMSEYNSHPTIKYEISV